MTVRTNRVGLEERTGVSGGFIEFTPSNYATGCSVQGIGGDGGRYDFNDTFSSDGRYGCLQFHDLDRGETVLAYNRFEGGAPDLGIGPNPDGQPDWTFVGNGNDYSKRRLTILVK